MELGSLNQSINKAVRSAREKLAQISSTERDRRAVIIGAAGLCLLVLYIVFHSISSGTDRLEKRVVQLETELGRIQELKTEYEESQKKIAVLSSKIKEEDEPLISIVEQILLSENLDRKNFSIRDVNLRTSTEDFYEERSIDVELKNISLKDLVDVLYKIQNAPSFLKVSNLNLSTKFDKSDSLTVKLRVSTFRFKEVT
ncbi:MAG: type 4a pilus biogenesis protein PilO [Candidatus Dadabacteria bacterium]|jgi:type II secretory pathway component PulM|nr:type 4a pilus biogenesis protein PilO [Candidatus Dadabacteria bacterium]